MVNRGSTVIATRCDFQAYEQTERQRRIFIDSTSSDSTVEEPIPSTERSRSRSREVAPSDLEEPSPSDPEEELAPDQELPDEMEEEEEDSEDVDLLQIATKMHKDPRTLRLEELLPSTSVITCDMTEVQTAQQLLRDLPWILTEVDKIIFPDSKLEVIRSFLDPWNNEVPICYHLFTDGSFCNKQPDVGGCGVVLAITTQQGVRCGGVLSRTCIPTARSYSAESMSMLWAVLVAYQLSVLHQAQYPWVPFYVEFGYDAETIGQQAAGHWTSFKHPEIQQLCRNVVYILQHRHGFEAIQWTHIKAHQGHWWNEIADQLAKHAIVHAASVQSSELLYTILAHPGLMNAFDWIWAYEMMQVSHPSMPAVFDGHLYHFRTKTDDTSQFCCHFGDSKDSQTAPAREVTTLSLNVATFNVLTLDTKRDKHLGTGSSGRHLSLLAQCAENNLHIVGVQETRAVRVTNRNNPWYHIISAPCRKDGHYGVQIWLHRAKSFNPDHRPFIEEDYRIIWTSYNALAIRIRHPALHCIIISARAPTSDKTDLEIRTFWNELTVNVTAKFPGWKIILLCDSNAHVGSCPSTSISSFGSEPENRAGQIYHDWLLQHDLWLPSTWETIHKGDHFTFVTPNGQHRHRLDFVGLSHNWPLDFVATEVASDIDASLSRCDHLPVRCSFTTTLPPPAKESSTRNQKANMDKEGTTRALREFPNLLAHIGQIHWTTDVHRHATGLATATTGCLQQVIPTTRRQLRKRHLADITWSILEWKRRLRKLYLDAGRRHRFGFIREVWMAWRCFTQPKVQHVPPSRTWIKMLDIKIALLEYNLTRVQPILHQMIKQDDAAYFATLAVRAGKVEREEGIQGLWKEIRGTLPKWKVRRALQKHDIDDALCQHFASLEAGSLISFQELYGQCVRHQNAMIQQCHDPQSYQLQDLPTRFEIEKTCRKTTPARAAGPDTILPEVCKAGAASIAYHLHNMIFKICCDQAEPIWYKGGYIHPIYKLKGPLTEPSAYRGVVLLDLFGKKFHAWLRGRLVPILQQRKSDGQLGGLPSEQTITGAHVLRVHGQVSRALRMSSAVIFVDVRAAFHHMLRELIFLRGPPGINPDHVLDSAHFDTAALQALFLQRCQTHPSDFPMPLRHLADDVHRFTWFFQRGTSHSPSTVISTKRGTRPGSPVADVGFNLLMCDLLEELQMRLNQDDLILQHRQGFPVDTPPITWVDDLAVPIATRNPADLEPAIQKVLHHIHCVFYSRGLQINYDKGKTETVMMFRGLEADTFRRAFFTADHEAFITTSTESHVFRVRAVPSYKHLGIRYQMDSDLEHEIQCRSALARTAFHELKRQIFGNRKLTIPARLQLLHSLVFSKLLYGSGSWYEIPRRIIGRLDSFIMKLYRSILDQGFWNTSPLTDDDLRAEHELPSARLLLATARLRFLHHVATHGHDYHRQLLMTERRHRKGWLFEVEDDLNWLRACIDLPTLPPTPDDVETWQKFMMWMQSTTIPWKSWIKRATRMHQLRERMAHECLGFHRQALNILKDHGAVIHEALPDVTSHPQHSCPECSAMFQTSAGVAVHRAKRHGIYSPIRDYVQSPVCPGCLKHMWTTQRVIQHLRYRPNRCLDRIVAGRVPQGHIPIGLPIHLQRVKRLPATRRHHGPLLPLPHQKERVLLKQRLRECEERGMRLDYDSPVNLAFQEVANKKLRQAAQEWLQTDPDNGEELYSILLTTMGTLPFPAPIGEKCLIKWIETAMWDDCAEWPPPALQILEDEHQHILRILDIWIWRTERDELSRLVQSEATPEDWDPPCYVKVPHPKKGQRAQMVTMHYAELETEERAWQHMVLVSNPTPISTSWKRAFTSGPYYILHLYSGRRRQRDLQWYLEMKLSAITGHVQIISVDTAVHEMCDVNNPQNWRNFMDLACSGWLLAVVLGPPCETWSAARHELLLDEDGAPASGPRPLRSSTRPWGIDSLLPREYRQIETGMRLLMRGLIMSIMVVMNGGAAVMEHPAASPKKDRASIWKTGLIRLVTQCESFHQFTFVQWKYGSPGVKPTTLLYGGLPDLPSTMRSYENNSLPKPTCPLVGRNQQGGFKTSAAKEYPAAMNEALAASIVRRLTMADDLHLGECPEVMPQDLLCFTNSLHAASSEIDELRSFLPDYQGR